jgi:outer membrane protein TolC
VTGREAPKEADHTSPLPPAIAPPVWQVDSDRAQTSGVSLPSDSDEAALDAIAASGQPLSLADAIHHAYRLQPRLRAQLEVIAEARGLQQIAFSTFLPIVAGRYDVGGFGLGAGGIPVQVGKPESFTFLPGLGTVPIGLNFGTTFEPAELRQPAGNKLPRLGTDDEAPFRK